MKSNWKDWLHTASNIAILAGIILVVWELQQNQTLTRAQLSSEGSGLRMEFMSVVLQPEINAILTKSCFQNNELSREERMLLARLFQSRLVIAYRNRSNELISNLGISYELNFEQAFRAMFSYPYGIEYYDVIKETLGSDVKAIGDRILATSSQLSCESGPAFYGAF